MTLQEAYEAWIATFPADKLQLLRYTNKRNGWVYTIPKSWDGKCCDDPHVKEVNIYAEPHEGMKIVVDTKEVQLPDSKVCARERAWRTYISIRDGVKHNVDG